MYLPRVNKIEWHTDGTATVTKESMLSGKEHSLTVKMTKSQYDIWLHGRNLVQLALPHLTPDEREFLMTGITPEEWKEEFGDDNDQKGEAPEY